VIVGVKGIPRIGGGLGGALSQIALGEALLAKKDPSGAIRAFLTVKLFYPSVTLLQPPALLGSAKAYIALGDKTRAGTVLTSIASDYPASPQVREAKKLSASLSNP
jgi:TolA-binding protein